MTAAVVCLSGGQDSTTLLGLALRAQHAVYCLGFDYGQRHKIELEQAQQIATHFGVPYKIIDIKSFGAIVTSALKDGDTSAISRPHDRMKDVPASFVPNRNALILTIAHAFAQEVGAKTIYGGMCQTDYSGYPDCRREFIDKLQDALNNGYRTDIEIETPLMFIDKAATFALAEQMGVMHAVLDMSHTCYNGVRGGKKDEQGNLTDERHEWGHGCGECPACLLRKAGYEQFQASKNPPQAEPVPEAV